jgi:hypothetical protein
MPGVLPGPAQSPSTSGRIPAQRDRRTPHTTDIGLPVALVAHAIVRLTTLAVLYVASQATGASTYHQLTRWDAGWYRRIAEHGYGHMHAAPDGRQLWDYAFFPLYPAAERVVSALTGLPVLQAGLLISALSSTVAAAGIFRVGEHLHDARTGLVLVCLWSSLPVSVVQSMAYTEALFTALAAWTLHALLVHRYSTAGVLAALAGLTRPLGAAIVVAVVVAALVELRARRRSAVPAARSLREPFVGAVVAPLGLLAYVAYVDWSEHRPLAYFRLAGKWGNGVDGGQRFIAWTTDLLASSQFLLGAAVVVGLVLLGAGVWASRPTRYPLPVFVYTASAVLICMSTAGYFGSKPRYLLPVFTLLLWPAQGAARLRTSRLAFLLLVLAVSSAVYGAVWLLGPGPP